MDDFTLILLYLAVSNLKLNLPPIVTEEWIQSIFLRIQDSVTPTK